MNIRTLSTMSHEEKFAIEKPKQELLDELGELVDQIENLALRYATSNYWFLTQSESFS
jgi:hypothetical protein